jgi:hypothetical protein
MQLECPRCRYRPKRIKVDECPKCRNGLEEAGTSHSLHKSGKGRKSMLRKKMRHDHNGLVTP